MRIFSEGDLREFLEQRLTSMRSEVEAEPQNRLLNVNEDQYVEYLVETYRIEPLELQWDGVFVSSKEELIPAEHFPRNFHILPGKCYSKQVVTYHIPFTGDGDLLRYTPSSRILWSTDVTLERGNVSFDIVNWRDNPEEIKREADSAMGHIRRQSESVSKEVAGFNERLRKQARLVVQGQKQKYLKQFKVLQSLGVPVKKSDRTPETFSVPTVKKKVIVKPSAPNSAFVPEPILDESLYQDILRICHETGVEMERHPNIYANKDEETLRDHFIMVLSPHFHSVTGETFNKSGKTDILIMHEGANVFVAECKFWKGSAAFTNTIDQVLSYLTWRDSKAAILNFVQNKELDPVLKQIEPVAAAHKCCVAPDKAGGNGWFNFRFHLPEDGTRGVSLAVLSFHLSSRNPV